MRKPNEKNIVRYYLAIIFVLLFFFFTNDFGLIDVQKTAIVMATGIDREDDTFIVTSQIAIPQSSQGKSAETVQIVSRGKTIAQAFEEINAKTGWYPKLVFCDLIILGEKTAQQNVFDALDYFLRDEYLSDNCLLATCDGLAKDMLNTVALVDPSSSTAIQKVLSSHAERVGSVFPTTLREFSIGYFGESKSGYMPVLKTEPQQEKIGGETIDDTQNGQNGSKNSQNGQNGSSTSSGNSGESRGQSKQSGEKTQDKPVFSAGETALFTQGKRVGTLTKSETFALCCALGKLRLASYSLARNENTCTLTVKRNQPKISLKTSDSGNFSLNVRVRMTAGILDYSKAQSIKDVADVGAVPKEFFSQANKKLAEEITMAYEKCRAVNCDIFGVQERLIKYERRRFEHQKTIALKNTRINVEVHFENVR